ncbi:MAG TPA: ABC transporter ATP-binding protein [Thermoplasmata archaeon]|nr:ABC transporter ATP-binding protein [Thermoplasmata archaeon]
MAEPLLDVQGLSIDYEAGAGRFHALTDVSLQLNPGRVVGIVGETGSGKSTLAHAIPRLLPEPPARIRSGRIVFRGLDILQLPKWKLPHLRGTGIGMIFQEPINSLNPAYRIFDQVAEAVTVRKMRESGEAPALFPVTEPHDYSRGAPPVTTGDALLHAVVPSLPRRLRSASRQALMKEVLDYLNLVRINDPETILDLYPHELSGGMRQRIMIAMALSAKPSLLIADEPTSALDITIQAQVLTLMKELMDEVRTSILFISHDLGVIAEMADDVGVLYAGHLVEFGPVEEVYANPRHPYTKLLMRAIPNSHKSAGPLPALAGSVPSLARVPPGCPFHPRCPLAKNVCSSDPGPVLEAAPGASVRRHLAACYFSEEVPKMP